MNCEEATRLMDGYLDGELDALTNREIELHLRDCKKCEQAHEAQRALVHTIGGALPYYKASTELRERVRSSLRQEITGRPMQSASRDRYSLPQGKDSEPRAVLFGTQWNWLALAAAIVLAAIIAF